MGLRNRIANLPPELKPQAAPGTWEVALDMLDNVCAGDKGAILNCGAGRGGLSQILDAAGYAVTSVDLHADHFQVAHLDCRHADLNVAIGFPDESFDLVLAVEVIEHLECPWTFFREAIRVLKFGGSLVVTSPNVESWIARMTFVRERELPYFRRESFEGCYHVTPIFSWALERCCSTCNARVEAVRYNRNDWPRQNDIPRHDGGMGLRRKILDLLPKTKAFGEIAAYHVRKVGNECPVEVGLHDA